MVSGNCKKISSEQQKFRDMMCHKIKKSDDLLGYTISDKPDPTVICHVAHEAVFFYAGPNLNKPFGHFHIFKNF
jgi:hypothetical protein